jgi:hypothetical protein
LKYKSGCLPTTRQPYNKWKCPESQGLCSNAGHPTGSKE